MKDPLIYLVNFFMISSILSTSFSLGFITRFTDFSLNSLTEQFNGDSIFVQTYVEDDGVRIKKTNFGKERKNPVFISVLIKVPVVEVKNKTDIYFEKGKQKEMDQQKNAGS